MVKKKHGQKTWPKKKQKTEKIEKSQFCKVFFFIQSNFITYYNLISNFLSIDFSASFFRTDKPISFYKRFERNEQNPLLSARFEPNAR